MMSVRPRVHEQRVEVPFLRAVRYPRFDSIESSKKSLSCLLCMRVSTPAFRMKFPSFSRIYLLHEGEHPCNHYHYHGYACGIMPSLLLVGSKVLLRSVHLWHEAECPAPGRSSPQHFHFMYGMVAQGQVPLQLLSCLPMCAAPCPCILLQDVKGKFQFLVGRGSIPSHF
jgi:hypothetical protein